MRFGWASLTAALLLAACGGEAGEAPGDDARVAEAAAFMAENADADGVVTLDSGLQYKVLNAAPDGAPSPDGNDLVRVHYEGSLTDGTVFDSSFERGQPAVFTIEEGISGSIIPGMRDALQHMTVGDEWLVYIPPELGYGEESGGEIPPNSVLVFRLKLLEVAATPGGTRATDVAHG